MALPNRRAKMVVVTVKLPASLHGRLASLAARRHLTASALVRDLLEASVSRIQEPVPGSFLAAARDLIGCVSGPVDLATNARCMDDFGS